MGLFLDLFKGLLVICDTEQTSAPHSVLTCDVCLRMDSTNSSFKWRLQCTHCICDITCITLGGGQLLNNSRNIVCVLNFVCDCICSMCVRMFVVWERLYLMWSLVVVLAQNLILKFYPMGPFLLLIYLIIRIDGHEIQQVSE